jgi:hypothetical protein
MLKQTRFTVALVLAFTMAGAGAAVAQVTCPPTRTQVTNDLATMSPQAVMSKYAPCIPPSSSLVPPKMGPAKVVTPFDNTFEFLDSCGYHPQFVEALQCSIEVRQPVGFFNGTMENVLFCLWLNNAWHPVNERFVRVWNEVNGANPNWYFGVNLPADLTLHFLGNNQKTYQARAIMSWFWPVPANDCNFQPIWGNWLDFQIRLDP